MKTSTFISIILLALITPRAVTAEALKATDYWEDSVYLSNNSELKKNIKESFAESKKFPKIIYTIDLGRKENERIVIGDIKIETSINIEKNSAIEKIKINYLVEKLKEPNLIGQNISFYVSSDQNYIVGQKEIKIIAVKAPGWEISRFDSDWILLENTKNELFGNQILILIEIQEQGNWKGRYFKIFNRNSILFEATMYIGDGYEFVRFDPELPTRFKTREEASSYEQLFELHGDSTIISEQIIKNKINFTSWLKGENYIGSQTFKGLMPKKIIEFNYTYDYQEDINKKVAEETEKATKITLDKIFAKSKESTCLALILFGLSLVLWLISMLKNRTARLIGKILDSFKKQFQKIRSKLKKQKTDK